MAMLTACLSLYEGGDLEHGLSNNGLRMEDEIAVIGAGCKLPGGLVDLPSLWEDLQKPPPDTRFPLVPQSRWTPLPKPTAPSDEDQKEAAAPAPLICPGGQPRAALLDEPEVFSPSYFSVSEAEAGSWDPHHRVLLMAVAQALHSAGLTRQQLQDKAVGVFVAQSNVFDWRDLRGPGEAGGSCCPATVAAQRVASCLGLRGGPVAGCSADCSSAMGALQSAVDAMRLGRCDVAVVGGVHLLLTPDTHTQRSQMGLLSKAAGHHMLGEGCGVLVLRRLGHAEADGNPVLALVGSVACSSLGGQRLEEAGARDRLRGLAQQALAEARCPSDLVTYLELSGTGRPREDARELRCLADVFRPAAPQQDDDDAMDQEGGGQGSSLSVGCIKASLGHLDAASGMAGLLKALLVLQHNGKAPPQHGLGSLAAHLDKHKDEAELAARVDIGKQQQGGDAEMVNGSHDGGAAAAGGGSVVAVSSIGWSGLAGVALLKAYRPAPPDLLMMGDAGVPPPAIHDFLDTPHADDEGSRDAPAQQQQQLVPAASVLLPSAGLLVLPDLVSLPWYQVRDKDGDDDDEESGEEDGDKKPAAKPKKPRGKKRKRGGEESEEEESEEEEAAGKLSAAQRREIAELISQANAGGGRGGSRKAGDPEAFLSALARRDKDVVQAWLEMGYEPKGAAVAEALRWGNKPIVKLVLGQVSPSSELYTFEVQVSNYPNAERGGRTLLRSGLMQLLIQLDRPELVPLLHKAMIKQYKAAHGNDKDYWNELRDRSADHSLPLHYAVRMRKAACIRPLAALGHSCDWKDFGHFMPIHFLNPANQRLLEELLASGANINAEDKLGHTMLWWAVGYQKGEVHGPEQWRQLIAQLRREGADYGRAMVREVRSDLSLGMESRKVPVEPPQDEAERPYPLFGYSIDSINNPIVQKGCGCRGEQGCTQNRHCECRNKNPGSSSPFFKGTAVLTDDGCTKSVIYQCGPQCGCEGSCSATADSLAVDVVVRHDPNKQWGVFTRQALRKGQYISTYVGEYISVDESQDRMERAGDGAINYHLEITTARGPMVIDATDLGSISRLFNNSCAPTMLMKKLETGRRYPSVAFFAARDVAEGEELTFTYNSDTKEVTESGQVRCYCGAASCRGYI